MAKTNFVSSWLPTFGIESRGQNAKKIILTML
jgi:hypothetical protein